MSTDRQRTPQAPLTADRVELDIAFEDTGGLSLLGFQKQASVKFNSPRMLTGFDLNMLLRSLSDSDTKANSPTQLLVAIVDTFINVTEDTFASALTDDDHQRLVESHAKLSDVVGENENHPLARLMDFIGNLIKDPEEKSGMSIQNPRRERKVARSASRPDVLRDANLDKKLATLLKPDETIEMRREEQVGRPANRPRLKLTDLLSREAEHIADREEL